MTIQVLRCPSWPDGLPPALADPSAGLAHHAVPARPGRDELAGLLGADPPPGRVAVAGTDADLAAVVRWLLRTDRLAGVAVSYLPASPASAVAAVWGLPTDPAAAADLARHGEPDPVPLVRDDAGGVLLGRGELRPMRGTVYCDDELVLRGQANRLEVTPAAPDGVAVRVARVGLLGLGSRSAVGRAVSVGCLTAGVVSDGVVHPRPVTRWTWYRHTEPLRLVRGVG